MTRLIRINDCNHSRCANLDDSLSNLGLMLPGRLKPYRRAAYGCLFFILAFLLLTGCPAPREPFSFYYDLLTGKQVPLALDLDRVAIAPSSLQLDEFLSSIVATEPLLENRISDGPGVLHYVVALVDDVTDEEVWALLDRLNEREDIQWARPYVHRDFLGAGLLPPPYTEGPELILDEITVLFSALTPGSTINALFEEYAVDAEWSEQFPFPFTAYTVLATEETGLTTLELANALHEDPLTIGAYPDFITLYIF